ncbi:MAG: TIGR03619 family F420-dependent LLM class oxidoreductase [Pseudomonadota bacterium]|nr:TIGR03619 family F420-dependent LLM class oxidoreductase [Pseudomonadota bacterium]
MKLGINMINFGTAASPDSFTNWANLAQRLGFHHLMTSDHVTVTPDVADRFPAPFYEPLSTLGWLAGLTKGISIGASVIILPYRSPLEIARAFANIDRLSGGRCILGVGVGWAKQEYAALNVPFEKRGRIANDYLAAIRRHWNEDPASYDGEFVSFENIQTGPAPIQSGGPPIWVGGASDAAMLRAIRYGDAWHPFRITANGLRDQGIPRLRKLADAEKRPIPAVCPRIYLRITENNLADDERVAGVGSIDQVGEDLSALSEMGCSSVLLDTYTDDCIAAKDPTRAFEMLQIVAEDIFDLKTERLR